jgi:squalene-hopene/tetraprenyl-beta-curcumene cyclase
MATVIVEIRLTEIWPPTRVTRGLSAIIIKPREMKRTVRMRRDAVVLGLGLLLAAAPSWAAAEDYTAVMERGFNWLFIQQNKDSGAYAVDQAQPAGTALVEIAILDSDMGYEGPFVKKGYEQILSLQTEGGKGGFCDPQARSPRHAFNTAVALAALVAAGDETYAEPIGTARDYLVNLQFSETQGPFTEHHWFYGGWDYRDLDYAPEPDLFHTGWALEALHRAELESSHPAWKRAVTFLERCQQEDGGCFHAPRNVERVATRKGEPIDLFGQEHSYGSATCAGLKGFLYAGLPKDDPRVGKAYRWIVGHFTLKEDPQLGRSNSRSGRETLFYYYFVLAKSLSVYGGPTFTDEKGEEISWAQRLADHLVSLQNDDGHWENLHKRDDLIEDLPLHAEKNPQIATAYALMALKICQQELSGK